MSRGAPEPRHWGDIHGDWYPGDSETPIVLVHGVMDRAGSFRRTARRMADAEIVAYDRRGYGRSTVVAVTTDIGDQVDDLAAVVSSLDAPPLVVGHSQGALIVLHALVSPTVAPLIAGAIVWEPPMPWEDWYLVSTGSAALGQGEDAAAEFFMREVIGDRRWERMTAESRAARRAEGAALIADLESSRSAAGRVDLAAVQGPVLAAAGSGSSTHGQRSAATVAELVPGARLAVIDDAPHGVHLSNPDAFASLIESERERLARR